MADEKDKDSETPEEGAREEAGSAEAASAPAGESLESLRQKAQSYFDQILRLQADFSNFRRRTEREKAEAIQFGRQGMMEKMISLADVMEEALKHAGRSKDVKSLQQGFQMVVREFERFLKEEGVEPLKTAGEPFDPHLHEAVERVATEEEAEHNRICEEVQKGYRMNGRLLRPARVKVRTLKSGRDEGKEK